MRVREFLFVVGMSVVAVASLDAQPYGKPDRGAPGDERIQSWLAKEAQRLSEAFLEGVSSKEEFLAKRPRYVAEYRDMLGISRFFEGSWRHTDLQVTITGTQKARGVIIDNLHFQSFPGNYVTANLYRPANVAESERLPTVLYVCGHAGRGKFGNKVAYQSHGIWFAKHGYNCLMLDTLQLGEIAGVHHGTYRERRWWWLSAGYTPAGIEAWNGVRAIDYLVSRPDVDPKRIAVTGISGGGAATFWVASADERVAIAAPVSGMADLPSYVGNRVINGHCDCMFLHNTYRWPWTRIAALVAPRPMLFVNSDADPIFPMDANDRVITRLERLYSLFGVSDRVDAVVSVGGHAYREDLRKAVYRFINTHFKNDPREVTDSEDDLVVRKNGQWTYPISPQSLRVFPRDEDLPEDAINGTADVVYLVHVVAHLRREDRHPGNQGELAAFRRKVLDELRERVFGAIDLENVRVTRGADSKENPAELEVEPGVPISLEHRSASEPVSKRALLVVVTTKEEEAELSRWSKRAKDKKRTLWVLRPRGVGESRWTRRNPPNYVERSHVLLGRTVGSERVGEVLAVARLLTSRGYTEGVEVAGSAGGAVLAAYAAALESSISGATLVDLPFSHADPSEEPIAPAFLNVLQVCDIPEVVGLIAPRPLSLSMPGGGPEDVIKRLYKIAGATSALSWLQKEDE